VPPGSWIQDVSNAEEIGVALVIAGDTSQHLSPKRAVAQKLNDNPSRDFSEVGGG